MNISYSLQRYAWKAVDWLYPPSCAGCGKSNWRFCPDCLSRVELVPLDRCIFCGKRHTPHHANCAQFTDLPMFFSAAASWAVYKGELREAIHALKFRQDLALGEFFSKFLIQLLDKTNWDFDMVIPVPLSRTRLKERTFNQSALLSRPIAAYYSVEHSQSPLKRIIDTGSQVSRTRVERNNALEDAFLGNPAKLKGRKVLLVDDIITTGATINHCASALKQAGAHEVFAISVAKTPKTNKVRDIDRLPDQNILFGGNNG